MAIGTGNIWRFPRVLAQNGGEEGGGAFLVAWLLFLFTWSIPVLILEFSLGKGTRRGTLGAFGRLNGKRWLWMGLFVGACSLFIYFYYSVVTGWCFRYAWASIVDLAQGSPFLTSLSGDDAANITKEAFSTFTASGWPVLFHGLAAILGGIVVARGIRGGVELLSKLLVPLLFAILVLCAARSLTLPGAARGLDYLFTIDASQFGNANLWIQALTQSAWSTGAGWGLVLTYASYMRKKEDVVLNSVLTGLGNNSASLLAALAIFPAVFALVPAGLQPVSDILKDSGPHSTGISFIWIPVLFARMPAGGFFQVLFFLALSAAAFSSLIAMVQLGGRVLQDAGMSRGKAAATLAAAGFVLGLPSALSAQVFDNQDWAWSVGLLFSGLFLALAVIRFGVRRFRTRLINAEGNDVSLGVWFEAVALVLIPVQGIALTGWWTITNFRGEGEDWWNPFQTFGIATCVFQFAVVVGLAFLFQKQLTQRFLGDGVRVGKDGSLVEGGGEKA
jgi:NSS family neurotransmitter:Na+ symporter